MSFLLFLLLTRAAYATQHLSDDGAKAKDSSSLMDNRLDKVERLLLEQDAKLTSQESVQRQQNAMLTIQESLLRQQSAKLSSLESLLRQQNAKVTSQESLLRQQSAKLSSQESLLRQQSAKLSSQESLLRQQSAKVTSLESEKRSRQETALFQYGKLIQQLRAEKLDTSQYDSQNGQASDRLMSLPEILTTRLDNDKLDMEPPLATPENFENVTSESHEVMSRSDDGGPLEAAVSQISQRVTEMSADIQALKNSDAQQDHDIKVKLLNE